MGFNAAHSNYSCIYCTIKKDERLKNVKITINVPLKLYATSNRYSAGSHIHPNLLACSSTDFID